MLRGAIGIVALILEPFLASQCIHVILKKGRESGNEVARKYHTGMLGSRNSRPVVCPVLPPSPYIIIIMHTKACSYRRDRIHPYDWPLLKHCLVMYKEHFIREP